MSSPIRITADMSVDTLRSLQKEHGRKAKKLVFRIDGEQYPEREMKADEIIFLEGINGEVVFQ